MNEVLHLDHYRQLVSKARPHSNKVPANPASVAPSLFFDRRELNRILSLYGRMVSLNEWRDYAIDAAHHTVEFQVFRNSWDAPAYRLIKRHPSFKGRRFAVVRARETLIEDDRLPAILAWLERQPAERVRRFPNTKSADRRARRP
ncbi:MAG: DUF2794 domain-containing protein [Proteobacteria bacterium]|nr:DUF2794 domain-containing protein [Pseudomonadota bacterium]